MCLYPRMGYNPKYKPNKKNGGNPPIPSDGRVRYIPIGCGECDECRKQKANEWRVRLSEELKHREGHFITLTFSDESIETIEKAIGSDNANEVANYAIRHWSENWRKQTKKQPRRWLITELGHPKKDGSHISTERIHLHGILFESDLERLAKTWSYGKIDVGKYCNLRTINYIVKYVTKRDQDHPGYKQRIFASKGIGSDYEKSYNSRGNKFNGDKTNEQYRLSNGQKVALPIYYRNKIYSEEQREQLWINKLDKQVRYIRGQEIDVSTNEGLKHYFNVLDYEQKQDRRFGFVKSDWVKKDYKARLKMDWTDEQRSYQHRSESDPLTPLEGGQYLGSLIDSSGIDNFEL